MKVDFSDNAKVVGSCVHCDGPTNNYENCALASCNDLVLICLHCKQNRDLLFHADECRQKSFRVAVQAKE